MKLQEVKDILRANVLTADADMEREVNSACGCDLMSDVLAFVKDKALLLTGLMNPQVVRTAEMMDIHSIVFVRGKMPDDALIQLAESKDIVLMNTELPLYISCGRLYQSGLVNQERSED
ncbi:MAG: hypothetical protein E7397_02615 [Ruminococcaceae bacterium]|nr:hypothetical protein [Oscillospiraceae bacterium]